MPTSTRFAVAVHILTNMAVSDGAPIRSEDLAKSASTGAVVIRGLISRLNEAGITRSQLGAGGGVQLAKRAVEISLLDVYRAMEEPEIFSFHRTAPSKRCPVGKNILEVMTPVLDKARDALEAELAKVTIADMATGASKLGKFTMPINW
ncbi:Rrf2 family transcriptional regulator [Ensifer adhaerens]|uniref:Rrf2 family transcriptional regulator n=1 Tax=Ensifer adhaerens TaxID=106592 RepID=UPI000DC371B1|nr:Rrf2 family transcriptional regulator [Ensifer adhaerens]RAR98752.1 BadM/Rrf2 family transcriptional regulator [Ensifer adhaerens]